jgi:hypothetical protein
METNTNTKNGKQHKNKLGMYDNNKKKYDNSFFIYCLDKEVYG